MRYTLYINLSNPSATFREVPCNSGIETVPPLLDELRRRGESVQIRNTAEMNTEELMTAYISEAAVAAVYGKYRVRNVFGSNRRPGSAFGQGVPALSGARCICRRGAQCVSAQHVGSVRDNLRVPHADTRGPHSPGLAGS